MLINSIKLQNIRVSEYM